MPVAVRSVIAFAALLAAACLPRPGVGPAIEAAVQSPASAPAAAPEPFPTECIPSEGPGDRNYKKRRIRYGNWQQTVILGLCVSDTEALAILRAIRDGALVNAQPVLTQDSRAGKAGQQANLPTPHVSQVSGIHRTDPVLRDALRAPAHQFMVTTVDGVGTLEGLHLYINLRDGQVELVGYGLWMS